MGKIITLKQNSDFRRLYKRGKSAVRGTMVVYVMNGRSKQPRLGITVSKKIGGAVERNRAKRRIREVFRATLPSLKQNIDICVVARGRLLTSRYDKVLHDFDSAASELNMLSEKEI